MKRFMLLMALILVAFAATDAIIPSQAQALMPLACTTAADYGWLNRGWNTLCEWALQMDPGWNEGTDGWEWTYLDTQQIETDDLQSNPAAEQYDATYVSRDEITKVTWYPLRT